jgi:hypothetical protein
MFATDVRHLELTPVYGIHRSFHPLKMTALAFMRPFPVIKLKKLVSV